MQNVEKHSIDKTLSKNMMVYEYIEQYCYFGKLTELINLDKDYYLSPHDYKIKNSYCVKLACEGDNLGVLKFLHNKIQITSCDLVYNDSLKIICKYGYIDLLEYIYDVIKIPKSIFVSNNKYLLKLAHKYNREEIIRFFKEKLNCKLNIFQKLFMVRFVN